MSDFQYDQTDTPEEARTRPYFVTGQADDGDATATIMLSRTYKAHGREIDGLEITEPNAKQLEIVGRSTNQIEGANRMLATLAKVPYASVVLFKARDINCCYEALASLGLQEEEE